MFHAVIWTFADPTMWTLVSGLQSEPSRSGKEDGRTGVHIDRCTGHRWVVHFSPQLSKCSSFSRAATARCETQFATLEADHRQSHDCAHQTPAHMAPWFSSIPLEPA